MPRNIFAKIERTPDGKPIFNKEQLRVIRKFEKVVEASNKASNTLENHERAMREVMRISCLTAEDLFTPIGATA